MIKQQSKDANWHNACIHLQAGISCTDGFDGLDWITESTSSMSTAEAVLIMQMDSGEDLNSFTPNFRSFNPATASTEAL